MFVFARLLLPKDTGHGKMSTFRFLPKKNFLWQPHDSYSCGLSFTSRLLNEPGSSSTSKYGCYVCESSRMGLAWVRRLSLAQVIYIHKAWTKTNHIREVVKRRLVMGFLPPSIGAIDVVCPKASGVDPMRSSSTALSKEPNYIYMSLSLLLFSNHPCFFFNQKHFQPTTLLALLFSSPLDISKAVYH
jgi:hypothetical protein